MDIFEEVSAVMAGVVVMVLMALTIAALTSYAMTVPGPWSSVVTLTEVVGLAAIGMLSVGSGAALAIRLISWC